MTSLALGLMLRSSGAPPPVIIADYYFAAAGDDATGDGSIGNPFQSIDKANALIDLAGNKVFAFKGGDTFPTSAGLFVGKPNITVRNYGSGKPTISVTGDVTGVQVNVSLDGVNYGRAVGAVTIKNLTVTGIGAATSTQNGVFVYADSASDATYGNVVVDGCVVSGFGVSGIIAGASNGSRGYDSITFANNECYANGRDGLNTYAASGFAHASVVYRANNCHGNLGKGAYPTGSGMVVGYAASGTVEFNTANGNGGAGAGGSVGIWAYNSRNVTIQYNESYGTTTSGLDGNGFGLDIGCVNCIAQYNYSHGNQGHGFLVFGSDLGDNNGSVVRYNISVNDGTVAGYGGLFIGQDVTGLVRNAQIYGNSVYQSNANGSGAVVYRNGTGNFFNCILANNVLYVQGGLTLIRANYAGIAGVLFVNNDYYGSTAAINWLTVAYASVNLWLAAATGQERVAGVRKDLAVDPAWTSPGSPPTIGSGGYSPSALSRYQIASGNALADAGLNVVGALGWSLPATDYFGAAIASTTLPVGAADAGASGAATTSQRALLTCGHHLPITVSSQSLYSAWSGVATLTNNTAAAAATKYRGANATVRNLMLHVATNGRSSTTVVNFYSPGRTPVLTISIPATFTGDLTETTPGLDTLADGDTYCMEVILGAGGGNLVVQASCQAQIQAQAFVQLAQSVSPIVVAQGVTTYISPAGRGGATATESFQQLTAVETCVDDHQQVYVTANTLSGTCAWIYRKNGVDQTLAIVAAAGQTGFLEDANPGHAVPLSADDLTSIKVVTQAGTGSITFQLVSIRRTGAVANRVTTVSGCGTTTAATTQRFNALGSGTSSLTTETEFQVVMPFAATLSRLTVRPAANTSTGASTLIRSRINGANGSNLATLAAGATGIVKDTTNTDTVAAGDKVAINSAAPPNGSITWQSYGLLVTAT